MPCWYFPLLDCLFVLRKSNAVTRGRKWQFVTWEFHDGMVRSETTQASGHWRTSFWICVRFGTLGSTSEISDNPVPMALASLTSSVGLLQDRMTALSTLQEDIAFCGVESLVAIQCAMSLNQLVSRLASSPLTAEQRTHFTTCTRDYIKNVESFVDMMELCTQRQWRCFLIQHAAPLFTSLNETREAAATSFIRMIRRSLRVRIRDFCCNPFCNF